MIWDLPVNTNFRKTSQEYHGKLFVDLSVKILGASPEAFEFPDLKIEGTKQASGN